MARTLRLAPTTVDVFVAEGVVTLTGRLERRSETEIAVSMTRQTDGVVAVIDQLTYQFDDSRLSSGEQPPHASPTTGRATFGRR
jgi:hypothetical protein